MAQTEFSPLHRSFVIEVRVGHFVEIQRNPVKHPRIDDRTFPGVGLRQRCDKYAAFAAKHELRAFLREAIVPNQRGITDFERDLARRVRGAHYTVAPTEGTTPQWHPPRYSFTSCLPFSHVPTSLERSHAIA